MSFTRFNALKQAQDRSLETMDVNARNSEIFGKYVFDQKKMRKYLLPSAFKALKSHFDKRTKIDIDLANQVADAMKKWALDMGATHYTHWFQPLTGLTAEKHDAFLDLQDGEAIEKFSGESLIQQEPDASSLPSGGIRNTFEARGYTAWDPSSPAFLMKNAAGSTLCIPSIFISYTGEALDNKAPLLKAVNAIEKETIAVCKYFHEDTNTAEVTLGVEQEYFLIDESLTKSRSDLLLTGRTLLGRQPAKGQQLSDHYFGSIPERIHTFMVDFESEALKLGIPITTRHNEVAPSQFECAPIFEEVNLAVDHNSLLMDLIDKVARRHSLRSLLHEKPFAKINGSGKHCNWSISTNTRKNLFSPGKTKSENLQFLTFLINTIKAVHDYSDLLMASISSASNDHRLGANEAPPAIISIFIGSELTKVLEQFEKNVISHNAVATDELSLNIPQIPQLLKDNTDRNRTSPFAFTGNKFEFRAVGSSTNPASPMIVLNTIVANQLKLFRNEVDEKIASGSNKQNAIITTLQKTLKAGKKVLFEGNNYSDEWVAEAEKRGLPNLPNTPISLKSLVSEKAKVFVDNQIFTEKENAARYEILCEAYVKKIQIESRVLGEIALSKVLPAAIEYQNTLIQNYKAVKEICPDEDLSHLKIMIEKTTHHIRAIQTNVKKMIDERKSANNVTSIDHQAQVYYDKVLPFFDPIRYHSDKLELYVDDTKWQIPKYRELLFL